MLHRKTIKHHHEPGDVHELTFSCFHQTALARHLDAVRRKLVQRAWTFSSARFYETDGKEHDPRCPKVTPLPAEYFQGYFGRKAVP
jgi:hypothetical protein